MQYLQVAGTALVFGFIAFALYCLSNYKAQ